MTSPNPGAGGSGRDDHGFSDRYEDALAMNRAGFARAVEYLQVRDAQRGLAGAFLGGNTPEMSDAGSDMSTVPSFHDEPKAPAQKYLSVNQPHHTPESSQNASTDNVQATGNGEDWRRKYRPQPVAELNVGKIVRDVSALDPGSARGAELNAAEISKELFDTASPAQRATDMRAVNQARVAAALKDRQAVQADRQNTAAQQQEHKGR